MGNQNATKITPEVISALQNQAEQVMSSKGSVSEIMNIADGIRQTFLDLCTKEAVKKIKSII